MAIRTRDQLVAWLVSKDTPRNRIYAKCVDCIYDEALGTNWRRQAAECTMPDCPLYPLRPKSKSSSLSVQAESNEN